MQKLIKIILFLIFPIITIFSVIFFYNILILDWRYAHKSQSTYQEPFNWFSYTFKIKLLNLITDLSSNTEQGLTKEHLYIDERSQKNLLSDVPLSTKFWQKGFYITINDKVKEIKVRHPGDNPQNWLFKKKRWRIQTKKDDQFGRYKFYNYLPYNLNDYIGGKIANDINILSPKYKLVELYINGMSEGIYIKSERINENFLRRNKIMPVNIYKGEQILSEAIVGVDLNLFRNSAIWSKVAFFNKVKKDDKSDIINFLNILLKSTNNKIYLEQLFKKLNMEGWVNFAAYQVIAQNYHNDSSHNMRLVFDPWSGKISPIIHDPLIGDTFHSDKLLNLEKSSHNLMLLLNRNTSFIDRKYNALFNQLTTNKILDKQLFTLKNLENKISISEKRDLHINANSFNNIDWKKTLLNRAIHSTSGVNERKLILLKIIKHKNKLIRKFEEKPLASWYQNNNGFNIFVSGHLPVSNIILSFKGRIPKWVSIDINGDNKIDKNEKFFSNNNGNVLLPLKFYANRIAFAENTIELITPNVLTASTNFNFITDMNIIPNDIKFKNPFSNRTYILKNKYISSVPQNIYNYPIRNKKIINNLKTIFSDTVKIDEDTIINNVAIIKPGTKFLINENVSIIFKNKVLANGTENNPITFQQSIENKPWGTIALQGKQTQNSSFKNVSFTGGSGDLINDINYTSMFSLHNTSNVMLKNIKMNNNFKYDDVIHLVYCKNIELDNILIENAFSDAIDIDISTDIIIKNSNFLNPKNDSIDLMESNVIIASSRMFRSGDKGISVGENSNVLIYNSLLNENKIGLAVKDKSIARVIHSDFVENDFHVKNYQKNFKYGDGGKTEIYKSKFLGKRNNLSADNKSDILIDDSSFNKKIDFDDKKILLNYNVSFKGEKKIFNKFDVVEMDKFFADIKKVRNIDLRGSDFLYN